MHVTELHADGTRTYAVVFGTDEEVLDGLLRFAREHDLSAAHFTALGAFRKATLGFFDLDRKDYDRIEVDEQVEVLNLTGNIARHEGEPKVHAHAVLGRRSGDAFGGHLLEAHVRPTLEVMVVETPAHLEREIDEATGLPLLPR